MSKKISHQSECPLSVDWHCRVETSHILTVLSFPALARDLPSGLHVTALTYLKAFKSARMHINNFLEKARGWFLRNILRNLVPASVADQRRQARASRRLPYLYGGVVASTSNLFPIETEGNTRDFPVKCSIVSTHHTFENEQE